MDFKTVTMKFTTLFIGCLFLTIDLVQSQGDNIVATTLECHIREFAYNTTSDHCWDWVRVQACWGRCDTSEYGDYKLPFKVWNHQVCTYGSHNLRRVQLNTCHPGFGPELVDVMDATSCACKKCDGSNTHCLTN